MLKLKLVSLKMKQWRYKLFSFQRFQFSDDKVSWNVDFPDYKPIEYTTTKILHNPKADSNDPYDKLEKKKETLFI